MTDGHDRELGEGEEESGSASRQPHPFFWLVLLALVPGVLVAWHVEPERPAWALRSAAVYRVEVGLAIFLAGYFLAVAVANAYKGNAFGRAGLPGGGEMDPRDPGLQEASEGATELQEEMRGGLRELGEAVSAMNRRVIDLEDRRLGERLARIEDGTDARRGTQAADVAPEARRDRDPGVR